MLIDKKRLLNFRAFASLSELTSGLPIVLLCLKASVRGAISREIFYDGGCIHRVATY